MKINSLLFIMVIFLAACGGNDASSLEELIESGDQAALKAKQSELNSQLSETEKQLKLIDAQLQADSSSRKLPLVSALKIDKQKFEHFIEIQGNVKTDQDVILYPEIQGILKRMKAKMGQYVKAGEVIAIIDDGGIQQQLSQAKAQQKLAKITFERQQRLWDQKIGSEIEFLRAETEYQALKESVAQLEKTLAKARVTAPYSGVIDEVVADEGQLMIPGQTPILRIVNLNQIYIHADVPETYLMNVKPEKKVIVDISVLGKKVETKVKKVGNYINPNNRTFLIEVEVPNKDGEIKPNLTAKLEINDYTNEQAILIPQAIINEDSEGNQYIYKIVDKNGAMTAQKTTIETGLKSEERIEITKGITAGEMLIEEGARTVKDGQVVKIIN